MKKSIIITALAILLLTACGNKESDKKDDFSNLDLSGMNLDFSKPQIQKYTSETQRDSIIKELSKEIYSLDENSGGEEESKMMNALVSFSNENNTITTQLKQANEVDFTAWKNLSICVDAESLTSKINEIIEENPSAEFGITQDLKTSKVNLYYKE